MSEVIAATASVAAMEDRLLTAAHVERMVSAESTEAAMDVLYDLAWASDLADQDDKLNFEAILRHGLWSVQQGILHTGVSDDVRELIFLPQDYQNALTTVMALAHGQQYDDVSAQMSELSFFAKKTFFAMCDGQLEQVSVRADYWTGAVTQAVAVLERDRDDTDRAVELLSGAYVARLIELARLIDDEVMTKYVTDMIHLHNLKTLVRRGDAVVTYYNPQAILPGVDSPISVADARAKVLGSAFADSLVIGEEIVAAGDDVTTWELQLEMQLCQRVIDATLADLLGPGRVLRHWLVKSRNAEIIRTILVAKASGASAEEVRDQLTPFSSLLET